MKVIEEAGQRLVLSIGLPYFSGSHCDFDRARGRATIRRWVLFWPRKVMDVPLDEIAEARLGVTSVSSQGGNQFYPTVLLKSGKQVNLVSFSESATRKAVDAINSFVQKIHGS